jgi:hypothetical protein
MGNRLKKMNLSALNGWILANYSLANIRHSKYVSSRVTACSSDWELAINERINSGKPILFGRLGGLEAACVGIYLDLNNGFRNPIRYIQSIILRSRRQKQLCTNAGVFPITREIFNFFATEHLKALEILDIFSVWAKPSAWVEANYLSVDETLFVTGDASFPWPESRDRISDVGWGMALENKKVLVISPFVDSFEIQSHKFEQIFQGIEFPNMKLEFLRAPLSQGGLIDGSTYKSHLSDLKRQMEQIEFDVALVSAGAYSLPLAAYAKLMGKTGVHAGGALQLFFGVTGQRYDNYDLVRRFINSSWKRPFEHERPLNWRDIEKGCYW